MTETEVPKVEITTETYNLLQSAIQYAVEELNDKIYERGGDYEDSDIAAMEDKLRDFRECADWLKIQTGRAFDWDAHWTAVKDERGDNLTVSEAALPDEHYVWTVMDDGEGGLCISPGKRFVNRLDYIITTEPWTDADELKEWIY